VLEEMASQCLKKIKEGLRINEPSDGRWKLEQQNGFNFLFLNRFSVICRCKERLKRDWSETNYKRTCFDSSLICFIEDGPIGSCTGSYSEKLVGGQGDEISSSSSTISI
jgi:hypothetical protein